MRPESIKQYIGRQKQKFQEKIERLEDEEIWELALSLNISEDLARKIWDESDSF